MQLIADSGSTKTLWVLLEHGTIKKNIETPGLNPYFITSSDADSVIRNGVVPNLIANFISEIHFYGAGCSTENNIGMLTAVLKRSFSKAEIHIYHDILGAARALCGKQEGIACILGTGCNSCYYDGKELFSKIPSLGYLFGDEGAGSYLGKKFLESYLKGNLPTDLVAEFEQELPLKLEDILTALYNKPSPNRFLASFSKFISPRQEHPFLHQMISSSFRDFFEEHVVKYDQHKSVPVNFVGSIAWYYRKILLEVAVGYDVKV
ncbi:MAG TPA: hypothetical protein VLR52_04285, partial [Bacteroidales bacterium]|nr:hypothetical protein [Bacteroidales bacterium]